VDPRRDSAYRERVSGEQTGAELAVQIQALVARELAQRGVRAGLRIEGDFLVLRGALGETRAELRGTLAQWDSLPDDLRERRVRQIAELLTEGATAPAQRPLPVAPAPAVAARRALGLRWYSALPPIAFAALTAGAIAAAYRYLAPRPEPLPAWGASASSGAPAASARLDPDRERSQRASSACEHTRARVAQGASIGPADSEGWVVELTLLRRGAPVDLTTAPGLAKFISKSAGAQTGTLTWPAATHLTALQRFDAEVSVSPSPPLGEGRISGLDLVFSGPYVLPYFSEEQRSDYLKLADALAEELEATDGALFARCASSSSHHIGSWFLGKTPGAAAASLVYFMASFTDVPSLKPSVFGEIAGPAQRGHAFDAISAATARIDRSTAATLVGRELGTVAGRPERGLRLTFPFRDADRALRASIGIARSLELANSG
jgi:hypothetical protein